MTIRICALECSTPAWPLFSLLCFHLLCIFSSNNIEKQSELLLVLRQRENQKKTMFGIKHKLFLANPIRKKWKITGLHSILLCVVCYRAVWMLSQLNIVILTVCMHFESLSTISFSDKIDAQIINQHKCNKKLLFRYDRHAVTQLSQAIEQTRSMMPGGGKTVAKLNWCLHICQLH